jgi:hypothetical protein
LRKGALKKEMFDDLFTAIITEDTMHRRNRKSFPPEKIPCVQPIIQEKPEEHSVLVLAY